MTRDARVAAVIAAWRAIPRRDKAALLDLQPGLYGAAARLAADDGVRAGRTSTGYTYSTNATRGAVGRGYLEVLCLYRDGAEVDRWVLGESPANWRTRHRRDKKIRWIHKTYRAIPATPRSPAVTSPAPARPDTM